MTQQVLRNEITELAPSRGLDKDQRREIADALIEPLADAFRMSINVRGVHWNVEGALFYSLHKLTDEQYTYIAESIDEIAERIRALGLPAPQTLMEFQKRSDIEDIPFNADLKSRIDRLVSDYEHAVQRMVTVVKQAEDAGDIKTADLLTEKIGAFEEFAWMLRATAAS